MSNAKHEWDLSYEYFYDGAATRRRLFSFGFALSPWQTVPYVEHPSVGKFEGDVFDPTTWRPQSPTTAYMEMRDDDAFWAARRVAAFTDELVRAAVHAGQFSDPAAEKHLADVLIKRRDKIARTYMTAINPIVHPRLDAAARLTFENAAVSARVAQDPAGYRATWWLFDNATGDLRRLSDTQSAAASIEPPPGVPATSGTWIAVDISADSQAHPAWQRPIRTYFRRSADGWTLVGLDRGGGGEEVGADPCRWPQNFPDPIASRTGRSFD